MTDNKAGDVVLMENVQDSETPDKKNAIATYRSYEAEDLAAIERRLVRKLDIRIMPVIFIIYVLNFLDRNSIAQARVYGLDKDTGTTGATWQTAISILSVGYVAMQIPSTLLMPKIRPSLFLPICMIVWAIVSGCTAFVSNTGGLLAVRFFLGIVEAPFFPCAIYYLSCWYPKQELGKRMALLVSGIIVSNAFAGLLSAAILEGFSHVEVLHTWSWLFIIEGLMTVVVAFCAIFLLPDYPKNTRWLTTEEKQIAQARLALDVGSADVLDEEHQGAWRSLQQAAKDHRVWLFACMQMATTASISYSHFFPTLIEGLGFEDNTTALLLTSPPYVAAFFWSMGTASAADKLRTRSPFALTSCVLALTGGIMAVTLPSESQWPRYGAMFLLCSGTYGIYTTTYTWLSSTIVQPQSKRAASIGIANSLANLASFYGNYFWLDKYEPNFTQSWTIIIAFLALSGICMLAIRWSLSRSNRRFESLRVREEHGELDTRTLNLDEQRAVSSGFRYVL